MHSVRLGGSSSIRQSRAAQPLPDLRVSRGGLGTAFDALITEVMAQPATEARPRERMRALAMTSWTSEPLSLSTEPSPSIGLDASVDGPSANLRLP